ncbi:MAG: hypothetical protein OXF74_07655 [Rhodobacteraceae bacterium]|nr:hypothetical protein [Paracoccaceae bacterium]
MAFCLAAVREEYWRLVDSGGKILDSRIPTREDIHARWHWQSERRSLKTGRDPGTYFGRNSYMISGKGHPEPPGPYEPPLEYRFRYNPMPMPWFDNPVARKIFRETDPEHSLLELLCAGHLAGWQDRPSGTEMFRYLTVGVDKDDDRLMVRELLCDIPHQMYPKLYREDAISAWHIARAAHECEVLRGRLSWWLNTQFAIPPWLDWDEVPAPVTRKKSCG